MPQPLPPSRIPCKRQTLVTPGQLAGPATASFLVRALHALGIAHPFRRPFPLAGSLLSLRPSSAASTIVPIHKNQI